MEKITCCQWPDTQSHKLVEKYLRVNRLHRNILERQLSKTGVFRSQHQILMFVAEQPNASQKEIAERYEVSTATIAVSLKKLEKGGYIRRIVDQKDNRFNQICLTDKGKKVAHDSVKIFRRMEQRMFDGFSEEEYQVMGDLLNRIYQNLEQEILSRTERED